MSQYIGSRDYYLNVLKIAIPIAGTMLLQSCMSVIDSIMVSSIGMVTAVGNAGNILMINNSIAWALVSGIGIFAAQFYGARQNDNLARTFGLSLIVSLLNALFWISAVYLFGEELLRFYYSESTVLVHSLTYLRILVISLIPSAISASFTTMYRSTHNTRLPFVISTGSALVNVFCNYLFIYVLKTGVSGAAYGTLIANLLSCLLFIAFSFKLRPDFIDFRHMFDLSFLFALPIFATALPIVINETFYGFGTSLFNKAYGMLGANSIDAYYVSAQVFEMFTFAIWGFGSAISIVVGTTLGSGQIEKAKKEAKYQLAMAFGLGIFLCAMVNIFAPLVLKLYHVSDPLTYSLAKGLLQVLSIKVLIRAVNFMLFSTLRAGGDAKILNYLDSGIMYLVGLPIAFGTVLFGMTDIVMIMLLCQIEQLIRYFITLRRYNSGIWARDLTKLVESN